ncbi:MAG: hypothetical protein F7C07_06115 [Desulfurococcales archaeon]|nr:hypothetical protein [Desulfurococcales archaeon]
MRKLVLPPDVKILEACGALGDGRVQLHDLGKAYMAIVTSSSGEKTYRVVVKRITENIVEAYSNDNGTIYRGYIGYPIISVLMLLGLLPRNSEVENSLKGIKWKELNEKYRKYSLTKLHVIKHASKNVKPETINSFVKTVMAKLRSLEVIFDEKLAETVEKWKNRLT